LPANGSPLDRDGGYTDDTTVEVLINNISSPCGQHHPLRPARRAASPRAPLPALSPDGRLQQAARGDFNHTGSAKDIIFLSFEPRMMSRDMSGRFAPIWCAIVQPPCLVLAARRFIAHEKSGYLNEVLAVGNRPGKNPFVAGARSRANKQIAGTLRARHPVGDNLSLTYRFSDSFLGDWQRSTRRLPPRLRVC
jgi:hypothetical protein